MPTGDAPPAKRARASARVVEDSDGWSSESDASDDRPIATVAQEKQEKESARAKKGKVRGSRVDRAIEGEGDGSAAEGVELTPLTPGGDQGTLTHGRAHGAAATVTSRRIDVLTRHCACRRLPRLSSPTLARTRPFPAGRRPNATQCRHARRLQRPSLHPQPPPARHPPPPTTRAPQVWPQRDLPRVRQGSEASVASVGSPVAASRAASDMGGGCTSHSGYHIPPLARALETLTARDARVSPAPLTKP